MAYNICLPVFQQDTVEVEMKTAEHWVTEFPSVCHNYKTSSCYMSLIYCENVQIIQFL